MVSNIKGEKGIILFGEMEDITSYKFKKMHTKFLYRLEKENLLWIELGKELDREIDNKFKKEK